MRPARLILRALERFRARHAGVTVAQVMTFLNVAESEGLLVGDLGERAGLSQSAASRSLRAMGPAESSWSCAPALGLVEAFMAQHDGRSHAIYLSSAGRALRDEIDALGEAVPTPDQATRGAGHAD